MPRWYGKRYPTLEDLVLHAEGLGCRVGYADIGTEAIYFPPEGDEPPVILLPEGQGPLRTVWLLAHELGHLMQHSGPKGAINYARDEWQANRWACCALIPQARVQAYGNASLDAFIGALSKHYEDLPPEDSEARRLAAHIAWHRLRCLETAG
jgi:Zn-dependent peptidase ImmA (M78 family)